MLFIWHKGLIAHLLWPLSWLYRCLVFLRRRYYQCYLKQDIRSSVLTIVIGNLTVGGSGKTPLLIALAQSLKKQDWRPGIISRGYGGTSLRYPVRVHPHSDPCEVGEESLLIARHTACPMMVDPQRHRGVQALLSETNCNIILSDDGLQHLALRRNMEIAVIDGRRRFGNGFCLPAGPLREPISRLRTVDLIVSKGKAYPNAFEMDLIPDYFYQLIRPENKKNSDFFYGKKLHAVAGIGDPKQFFDSLRHIDLTLIEHPFPDHYFFNPHDFNYGHDTIILMTEKDAIKCEKFADARLWCVHATTKLDESFYAAFYTKLSSMAPV